MFFEFREERHKVNLTWTTRNDSILYRNVKYWHFVPELSNGTEDDVITQLNAVAVVSSHLPCYIHLLS
jgi:hypothetical protein